MILCVTSANVALKGIEKTNLRQKSLSHLDTLYQELLLQVVKGEKADPDKEDEVQKLTEEVEKLNEKAGHSLDAAKVGKTKIKISLAGL